MEVNKVAEGLMQLVDSKAFVSSSLLYWTGTVTFLRSMSRIKKSLTNRQTAYLNDLCILAQKDLLRQETAAQEATRAVVVTPKEEPKFISLTEYLASKDAPR